MGGGTESAISCKVHCFSNIASTHLTCSTCLKIVYSCRCCIQMKFQKVNFTHSPYGMEYCTYVISFINVIYQSVHEYCIAVVLNHFGWLARWAVPSPSTGQICPWTQSGTCSVWCGSPSGLVEGVGSQPGLI